MLPADTDVPWVMEGWGIHRFGKLQRGFAKMTQIKIF